MSDSSQRLRMINYEAAAVWRRKAAKRGRFHLDGALPLAQRYDATALSHGQVIAHDDAR